MLDMKDSFEAFIHGELDFNGLVEAVKKVTAEAPEQIPELTELIEVLYSENRLPPQIHGVLLSQITQETPSGSPSTSPPEQLEKAAVGVKNQPETGQESKAQSDRTRINSSFPIIPTDKKADPNRITTPPPSVAKDERTRIATESTSPSSPSKPFDQTRIARERTSGSATGQTGSSNSGASPSSTGSSWRSTAGIRTASQEISREPAVGDILKDRFVLEKELGRGGMGIVFKALDQRKVEARDRHPYVALKLLNESFKQHAESLVALQREARKAQDLKHPNVINIFDFDKDGRDNYFIAMELLDGQPLDKVIKTLRGTGLAQKQALNLIDQMGHALSAAHNHKPGIIHSDFKPGNVFLTQDNEVKVFDFGIARAAKPKEAAKADVTAFDAQTLGALTPTYASLEMLEGEDPDPRDDIYALAIVAYELLSGNRPFGRTPADKAMAKGLVPKRIHGLTRRQWNGLQRGLAFKREDRSPTVEDFLDDLKYRKSKLPMALVLSGIGIGLASWLTIPTYLEKRRESEAISGIERASAKEILAYLQQAETFPEAFRGVLDQKVTERLVQLINSGNRDQVIASLDLLDRLPTDIRRELVSIAKEAILTFYLQQIDMAFSPLSARYDYAEAERWLEKVRSYYPDSIQVFRTTQRIEDSRNDLLNELDSRFNQHLNDGRLLSIPEQDDMTDVLRILEQLNPHHQLLSDARLSNAYAEQATTALDRDEFDKAERLVTLGLKRFRDDATLDNIQAKIHLAQENLAAQARLAKLQARIRQHLPQLDTLENYLELSPDLAQLKSTSPQDPLLVQVETGLRKLLDRQLDNYIQTKAWQQAEDLIAQFSPQLSEEYRHRGSQKLASALSAHETSINNLFKDLGKAVADGRLSHPPGDNAMKLLEKARRLAPEDERIDRGLASIAQAYLELSRQARAKAHWEEARTYVRQGLGLDSPDAVTESLRLESTEITKAEEKSRQRLATAEREKLEQEKQDRIRGLYEEFEQRLNSMTLSVLNGQGMLSILDRLAALNPTDPLLEQGRKRIADRFELEAQSLSQAGQWQQAITLIQNGIDVIPESELLTQRLDQLKVGYENQQAADRSRQIREQKAEIEQIIAKPDFSSEWSDKLLASLQAMQELLPASDPWVKTTADRVARLYLQQASLERTKQQFAKTGSLLQIGERFAPQLAGDFSRERMTLAAEEQAWETANQARIELARLEGTKQSLLTQAKANDVSRALKTLEVLRAELTTDDPFLQVTAPEAIGDAYLRLAERRAKHNDFETAMKLVKNGLDVAPKLQRLQDALDNYQVESTIQTIRQTVESFQPNQAQKLQLQMEAIASKLPKRYRSVTEEFASILAKRIESTPNTQTAKQLLDAARSVFPDDPRLNRIVLTQSPQASVIAAQGLAAVKAGKLTRARALLQEAESKEKGHSDLKLLRDKLAQRVRQAESAYDSHNQALNRGQRQQAKSYLKQAITIWNDNSSYRKALVKLDQPVSKERCNPKYAGYGKRSSKFRCYDPLQDKQKGPIMVVVPAGGGNATPYAIGRYEISIGDYNNYCQLSSACKPISGKNSKLPLTDISLAEAQNYARWLTRQTGATYRLPSSKEWTHAAKSRGSQPPGSDFNCLLLSGGSVIKGGSPVNVNVAPQNDWGLFNYIGNVQEWVITNGNANALGGHFDDPARECNIDFTRRHDGNPDQMTGFRLLREIKG